MPNGGPPEEVGFRKDCIDWYNEVRRFELAKQKYEDATANYKTAQTLLSNAEIVVKANFDPSKDQQRVVDHANETIIAQRWDGRFSIEVVDTE